MSRPAPKRIRSDRDHSQAEVKAREKQHKKDRGTKAYTNGDNGDREEEKKSEEDDDWLSKPPFSVGKSWDGWKTKWRQSCWCNKIAFVYDSDPEKVKVCHCEDCQRLHGAPNQHAAIFYKHNARLDSSPEWLGFLSAHGEVHPLSDTPTPLPHKISCRACGSPLVDEGRNMILSFPPTFEFPRTRKQLEEMNAALEEGKGKQGKHKGPGGVDGVTKAEGGHGEVEEGEEVRETHRREMKWEKAGLPDCFKHYAHIFYERRAIDVIDGLPKWRGHADGKSEEMGETER